MTTQTTNDRLTALIKKAQSSDLTTEELAILRKLLNRLLDFVDDELYCKDVRK